MILSVVSVCDISALTYCLTIKRDSLSFSRAAQFNFILVSSSTLDILHLGSLVVNLA